MTKLRDWLKEHWKAGNGTMPDDLANLTSQLEEALKQAVKVALAAYLSHTWGNGKSYCDQCGGTQQVPMMDYEHTRGTDGNFTCSQIIVQDTICQVRAALRLDGLTKAMK